MAGGSPGRAGWQMRAGAPCEPVKVNVLYDGGCFEKRGLPGLVWVGIAFARNESRRYGRRDIESECDGVSTLRLASMVLTEQPCQHGTGLGVEIHRSPRSLSSNRFAAPGAGNGFMDGYRSRWLGAPMRALPARACRTRPG